MFFLGLRHSKAWGQVRFPRICTALIEDRAFRLSANSRSGRHTENILREKLGSTVWYGKSGHTCQHLDSADSDLELLRLIIQRTNTRAFGGCFAGGTREPSAVLHQRNAGMFICTVCARVSTRAALKRTLGPVLFPFESTNLYLRTQETPQRSGKHLRR